MKIALTNCRLIDGRGGEPLSDATVVIDGDRIAAVGPGTATTVPSDAQVLDVAGSSVLPGLIDLHLHLLYYYLRPDVVSYGTPTYNDPRITMVGVWHMQQLLDAGITSVRDVGSCRQMVFDLKWALGEGLIRGPRIWAAGRLIAPTGGHGSENPGLGLEFDGVAGALGAVREEIKAGADFIKLAILQDEWTFEELQAAVDLAHRMGRRVACHVNYPPSITNALKAGVDSIEHGCLVTEAELEQMRDQGTYWVITPLIYHKQFENFKTQVADPNTPADVVARARDQVRRHEWIWDNMPKAMLRAAEMGVKIGLGSDQLFPKVGIAALPLDMAMAVEIGLPPMLVIQGVTSTAAECIGCQEELGTLEPGKLADLIVVEGDPLADMTALQQVAMVIKNGQVEKNASGITG
jgi:imidazolonepropionase-like amidohydrolase